MAVNVLNLIEGEEAIVTSPENLFAPFVVHYAETFIIPENIKEYTIAPYGKSKGQKIAILKAYVRVYFPFVNKKARIKTSVYVLAFCLGD